jgi:hypothetical protein
VGVASCEEELAASARGRACPGGELGGGGGRGDEIKWHPRNC